jgi:hypothetical protein
MLSLITKFKTILLKVRNVDVENSSADDDYDYIGTEG